jgi:hypothetical protein
MMLSSTLFSIMSCSSFVMLKDLRCLSIKSRVSSCPLLLKKNYVFSIAISYIDDLITPISHNFYMIYINNGDINSSPNQQQHTQSFDELQDKPFWVLDVQEHKLKDIRTKGESNDATLSSSHLD